MLISIQKGSDACAGGSARICRPSRAPIYRRAARPRRVAAPGRASHAPVAQGIEQRFPKPRVGCSSHPGGIHFFPLFCTFSTRRATPFHSRFIPYILGFSVMLLT